MGGVFWGSLFLTCAGSDRVGAVCLFHGEVEGASMHPRGRYCCASKRGV